MAQGTPIYRHLIADYIRRKATPEMDFVLLDIAETLDENINMQTVSKTYTADKGPVERPTGAQPTFPIDVDMYDDNPAWGMLDKYAFAPNEALDVPLELLRVFLWDKEESKSDDSTWYSARLFETSPIIETISGSGGEIVSVSGTLNSTKDVVHGYYNIQENSFLEHKAWSDLHG